MFICQECGGQNGLHFQQCIHSAAKPRVHAFKAPRVGSAPGPLPYMHSPTGRTSMEYPQMQNLPGTLAHAIEMLEAKHGPVIFEGLMAEPYEPTPVFAHGYAGNMQAGHPSEPHRSMARMEQVCHKCHGNGETHADFCALKELPLTDEQKLVALLGPDLSVTFTHRDKGGRYKLLHTPLPAGEVMRKVGDTVVYTSLDNKGVYVRDLADFVAIMQPLMLSDS